jgi:hypothetical protein
MSLPPRRATLISGRRSPDLSFFVMVFSFNFQNFHTRRFVRRGRIANGCAPTSND